MVYINPTSFYNISMVSFAAVISTFAASIGEAAMLGYLKGIPQELIIMYGIGKSSSRCFGVLALTLMTIYGSSTIKFFFLMVLLVGPYIICFDWMDGRR